MGDQKRSSLTFFVVCPYTVLLGRARRKVQMRGVHKPTTSARQHDLYLVASVGCPNLRKVDEERFDGYRVIE